MSLDLKSLIEEANRKVVPISDSQLASDMQAKAAREIIGLGEERFVSEFLIADKNAGKFCVYDDEQFPNRLMEIVISNDSETSVWTLLQPTSLYESAGDVIKLRSRLIEAIGRHYLTIPSVVQVFDETRNEMVFLKECGTAQLIDLAQRCLNGEGVAV